MSQEGGRVTSDGVEYVDREGNERRESLDSVVVWMGFGGRCLNMGQRCLHK